MNAHTMTVSTSMVIVTQMELFERSWRTTVELMSVMEIKATTVPVFRGFLLQLNRLASRNLENRMQMLHGG